MTILKCKICGGSIQISGETHGICDSCGCEVTLPKIDDDKKAYFYNRGNTFRQMGSFDEAYLAYQQIIAEDSSEAEAYWNLMLCRYGIEYEKDVRKGEYLPTCSRLSDKNVLDDSDYLNALKYADEYQRDIYRKEAMRIADIQQKFLEISRKEKPYDVFICFKAEKDNGERTRGSIEAQEIYTQLEKEGVKVFFSRVTLENMLGKDYEPRIYAALNSAKIMLLIADEPHHINARWVKNEWKRYLAIMEKDKRKQLYPICIGMDKDRLPREIPYTSAIDWSKPGAMQDLIAGILKVVGKKAHPVDNIDPIDEIERDLKERNFIRAKTRISKLLDVQPENGKAHFYALLADNEARNLNDLSIDIVWENNLMFKRAKQFADEETKNLLNSFEQMTLNKRIYKQGQECLEQGDYEQAIQHFYSLGSYMDSEVLAEKARRAQQHKQEYKNTQKEFQHNVRDGEKYLVGKLKQNYAEQYQKLIELDEKSKKGIGLFGEKKDIVCALILLVSALLMPFVDVSGLMPFVWSIALYVLINSRFEIADITFGCIGFVVLVVLGALIPVMVFELLDGNIIAVILFIIASASAIVVVLRDIGIRREAKNAGVKRNEHYANVVKPCIEDIVYELKEKYEILGSTVDKTMTPIVEQFDTYFYR